MEGKAKLTDAERRYLDATHWLTEKIPGSGGKNIVNVYREKSEEYADAVKRKANAYGEARERIGEDRKFKDSLPCIREQYAKWDSENSRKFDDLIKAAWMDWVVTGKKDEVESNFAAIDGLPPAMAQIECSKVRLAQHCTSGDSRNHNFCTRPLCVRLPSPM